MTIFHLIFNGYTLDLKLLNRSKLRLFYLKAFIYELFFREIVCQRIYGIFFDGNDN